MPRLLIRHVHRRVVLRIAGVASVVDVTQIDTAHVEDHSAVSPTWLDSLVEDLSEDHHTNLRDVGRMFRFFLVLIEVPMNVVLPVPSRVGERGRTTAMKRSNGVHCLVHRPTKQRRAEGRWGRGESSWHQKSHRARPNLFRIGSHPARRSQPVLASGDWCWSNLNRGRTRADRGRESPLQPRPFRITMMYGGLTSVRTPHQGSGGGRVSCKRMRTWKFQWSRWSHLSARQRQC